MSEPLVAGAQDRAGGRSAIENLPTLVWVAASDGSIEFLNGRWADYTGLPLEGIQSWEWISDHLVHPQDAAGLLETWRALVGSGKPGDAAARLRRSDGQYRWFLIHATPQNDGHGGLLRWYGTLTDVDDEKRSESLLRTENQLLERLARGEALVPILDGLCRAVEEEFEGCYVSILILDPKDQRLWYGSTGSLPASYTAVFNGLSTGPEEAGCATAAYRNEPVVTVDIAVDPLWARHRETPLSHGIRACWSTPIQSSKGRVLGTFAILSRKPSAPSRHHERVIEQMTHLASVAIERHRMQSALAESEERFRSLADAIPEVIWITTLDPERALYASPSFARIWGHSVEDLYRNPRLWTDSIHPDDRHRVADAFHRWVSGEAVDYHDVEFRIVRPDGTIRWIHERGVILLDDRGKPYSVSGISTDITERKRSQEDLRRSEACLAEAQRLSATGSFGWRPASGEMLWSEETYCIFGVDRSTRPTVDLVLQATLPEDRPGLQELIERATREGKDWKFEHRLLMPDGAIKHLHVVARAMHYGAEGAAEYVGAVMDVTAATEARQALEGAYSEIQELKEQLQKENIVLREEVDKASMFEEIVGTSQPLRAVLSYVAKVAPTDSTVLITGETGTGKELIARAIHKRSKRSSRVFVSVNCASIPPALVASELFGHEKGAFTGALQRRIGRFELAEGGTIFLDEVGELPPETQLALLRVLQEREFERVGGGRPIRADVRVLAATNRNLEDAVAAGVFRSDLFYRLNVVPVLVPSLRDRKEDIPLLVEYFVNRYSRNTGKDIRRVSKKSLELLRSYSWPGNIRELQNVIERSVILTETDTLTVDERWLVSRAAAAAPAGRPLTAERDAHEKAMIETALAETQGRVAGPSGAAAKLQLPASTLEFKIRTLGIDKRRFRRVYSPER